MSGAETRRPAPFTEADRRAFDWIPSGPLPAEHPGNLATAFVRDLRAEHARGQNELGYHNRGGRYCEPCECDYPEPDISLSAD